MSAERKNGNLAVVEGEKRQIVAKPITYREISGRRFAVLVDEGTKSKRMVPADVFEKQWNYAKWALETHPDYLNAVERKECKKALACEQAFKKTRPEISRARIEKMIRRKVPPIFREDMEGSNNFPSVDYILRTFRGDAWNGHYSDGKQKEPGSWFYPATVEHVYYFRTYAFDGNRLSPLVLAEFAECFPRQRNSKLSEEQKSWISYYVTKVLKHLEGALRYMKTDEREFREFREGEPLDFTREAFWHIHYSREDRLRIMGDFLERFTLGEESVVDNEELVSNMRALFPLEVGQARSKVNEVFSICHLIKAIEMKDLRGVMMDRLPSEADREVFRGIANELVDGFFDGPVKSDPSQSISKTWIQRTLNFSTSVLRDPVIFEYIAEKQIEALKGMSDEQILKSGRSFAGILGSRCLEELWKDDSEAKSTYYTLVKERLEAIRVRKSA